MSHRVRRASISDLEKLVAFTLAEAADSEASVKDPVQVTKGVLAGLEHEETARYWVLEDEEGAVIGSTSVVKEWSDWSAGYYWLIQSMFLKPQYRGQGLMKLLLDEVRHTARAEEPWRSGFTCTRTTPRPSGPIGSTGSRTPITASCS